MIYPESIYNTYEIAEKDICGEKHYALVRVYSFLGLEFRRRIKIYEFVCDYGCAGLKIWYKDKESIENAIQWSHRNKENKFRDKMTK